MTHFTRFLPSNHVENRSKTAPKLRRRTQRTAFLGNLQERLRAYVHLDGGTGHRADAQDLQSGARRSLFALFDGVAFARGDLPAIYRDGAAEVRTVRRTVFGLDPVDGPESLGLKRLLQQGLPVPKLVGVHLRGVEDLIDRPVHELFVYEVRGAYDRLDRVRNDGFVDYGAFDVLLQPLATSDSREVGLAHQMRPDACEIPFQQLRVPVEDQLGYPAVKDRVTEELQPTVRVVGVGDAGVGERPLPQRLREYVYQVS